MSTTFLLSSILALAVFNSPARAQNFTINAGQVVTVPGSQSSPWNIGGNLTNRGDLHIIAGGIVTVGGTLGHAGNLLEVSGSGSELHVTGIMYASSATGTLQITNGGLVKSATSYVNGGAATSHFVEVSGSGSQWTVNGHLIVGDNGNGILRITDDAIVEALVFGTSPNKPAVSSYVEVSGGGQLKATSGFAIGEYHTGALLITNKGVVTSGGNAAVGWVTTGSETGEADISGVGSRWDHSGRLYVGQSGNGTMRITNGGVVTSTLADIGASSTGNGHVLVSGSGSRWDNSGYLNIGVNTDGLPSLLVINGGIVTSGGAAIGQVTSAPLKHIVEVSGQGSRWENNGFLEVGATGLNGVLRILGGGFVGTAGANIRANSWIEVSGTGSWLDSTGGTFTVNGYISSGYYYGLLHVRDGGLVTTTGVIIGVGTSPTAGQSGEVEVTDAGSRWDDSSNIAIGGAWGGGSLLIGSGGAVSAPTVDIAMTSSSLGVLVIGGWTNWGAEVPGTLTTSSITFGAGFEPLIVFNHTSSNYVFDATINNGADNAAGSGTGLVGPGVIWAYSGRTILNADHGDFTGELRAGSPGILQVNGDMSGGTALVYAGGRLEGNGIVGSTESGGVIAPGASIGVLTIAGDYTGNNGILHIEAVLGDDNSPTDRLVITGDVFGSTMVAVSNRGGLGAQTINGIRIIEVGGISPGNAFVLRGDYVTATGQQAVIGGAYAYTLQHNSPADPNDGNWYLTSEFTFFDPEIGEIEEGPRYQPGVALYEQYPQVLASLNTVPTLQQRVGNTYWSQNGAVATVASNTPGTYGMWGRIEGTRTASDPARSTSHAHRDTDLWKLQTGFDFGLHQGAEGALVGGVNISYGKALADIASPYGRGKVDATGAGIGATLTWYGAGGFYVDGQAQVTWFDSDITSTTEGRKDVKGNNGHGYVLSAETGNRYQLGNGFSLTPQVQLVYSRVDFDSFTDPFGARVSLYDGDSLRGRFGVSLDHEAQWVASDGTKSRSHLYAIANLYNEFLDGSKINVDDVRFATRDERLWAGIGIGGTYEWANGAYAFYGNANIAGSVEHMSDSYAFGGTLGFRARW